MSQETLRMSKKERGRVRVLGQLKRGEILLKEAAHKMNVSRRQAMRLAKRYREQGEAGVVHKGRDRPSNRAFSSEDRDKIISIYKEKYWDFGPTLACEKLAEDHNITLSRETLRQLLMAHNLWRVGIRERTHRKKRKRRARFGELVQIDGSDHEWFEERGQRATLIVMIDDATGRIALHMAPGESTEAALWALRNWVERFGVPEALYADKKPTYFSETYVRNPELRDDPKTFSKFMSVARRMGTEMIVAHSPQAKGRVERANLTLQDRLVKELRLRGIKTIPEANAMLGEFAEKHNAQFAKQPLDPVNAHRLGPATPEEWEQFFSIEEPRKVARDNTVVKGAHQWQILKQDGAPRPGQRVIHRHPLGQAEGYWVFAGRRLETERLEP